MDLIRFDRTDHHPVTFAFVADRNFPDSNSHRAVCNDRQTSTSVFGRNAQIAAIRRRLGGSNRPTPNVRRRTGVTAIGVIRRRRYETRPKPSAVAMPYDVEAFTRVWGDEEAGYMLEFLVADARRPRPRFVRASGPCTLRRARRGSEACARLGPPRTAPASSAWPGWCWRESPERPKRRRAIDRRCAASASRAASPSVGKVF